MDRQCDTMDWRWTTSCQANSAWQAMTDVDRKTKTKNIVVRCLRPLPSSLLWAQVWQPEHGIASRRLAQLPSAMPMVDNEQPRQDRTDLLWCRPDVIPSWMRLLYDMSWGIMLELTLPRKQFITVFGRVVFGLGEKTISIPLPRLHKQARLNWIEYHVN